ncbi:kinase-like domain-containing protein [Ilyonectria sp. MPI-CAGE-AT-0026]|nr:kinase-like domain-containing protein [Ilyonectria sp. MPI-CAGE-AT-0026]
MTNTFNLDDFRLLKVIGRGAFGKVRIVERKDTNLPFALKYIRKDKVVRPESLYDIEYIYNHANPIPRSAIFMAYTQQQTFTEDAVGFWIAELGCALRYIHSRNIIHRDIKPDSVLLDADSYVHLTDFNVASDVAGWTLTIKSGTLAYLAPEVYTGNGYDVCADLQQGYLNSRTFLSEQTTSLLPPSPPPVPLACLYAISSALDPNRDTRMGSTWDSFANHEFFKLFDFELLE